MPGLDAVPPAGGPDGDAGVDPDAEADASEAGPADRRVSIAAGRKIAKAHRDKCSHTLHFCTKLLCNELNCRLRSGMAEVPSPLKATFDEFLAPYYEMVIPHLHDHGIMVIIDSDGDISVPAKWYEDVGEIVVLVGPLFLF